MSGFVIGFDDKEKSPCRCTPPINDSPSGGRLRPFIPEYPEGTYWMCNHKKPYLSLAGQWLGYQEMTMRQKRSARKLIRAWRVANNGAKASRSAVRVPPKKGSILDDIHEMEN